MVVLLYYKYAFIPFTDLDLSTFQVEQFWCQCTEYSEEQRHLPLDPVL
jgi:hypothetical protein